MSEQQVKKLLTQLGNKTVPLPQRAQQIIDIMAPLKGDVEDNGTKELFLEAANEIFDRLQSKAASENAQKLEAQLKEIMQQVTYAPLRLATFIESSDITGVSAALRAIVMMDNGEMAHLTVPNQGLIKKLKLGDRILVDGNMKLLVDEYGSQPMFGLEGRFERLIDDHHVEIVSHQDEKSVVMVSDSVVKQIKAGEVAQGAAIILGSNGRLGIHVLPQEEKLHFRFLDRGPVPDVIEGRDIGSPPKIIGKVSRHVREEMTRPELRRRFRLRPCITSLLAGVSGSGKTLARNAIHHAVYEVMSEITGTPISELPPRVFVFKTSQMLSMWLGESDKNIDRLFDEVEKMADTKYTNGKGKEFVLPVMVVMEEADGMGRSRGASQDAIYDRILTTLLQRLDPNRCSLANKLVVVISTTNEPHMVDPAFLRRIGGSVETFGRLDEKGFVDILSKHINGIPLVAKNRTPKMSQSKIQDEIVEEVADWLFNNGDEGVVALTYQGQVEPEVKYLRDFLTGALIDRAVQSAATEAWESAAAGNEDTGVSPNMIANHLKEQVLSVAHQLVPQNVGSYIDIPENVRVTSVKRIQQKQHANK